MSTSVKVLYPAEFSRYNEAKYTTGIAHASYAAQEQAPATSDEADGASPARRGPHAAAAVRYAVAAAGCALFAFIYAQFSHGVYSPFMTFMFAIPLVGGLLPALGLHLAKGRSLPRLTRQGWALALASLTVASCLRGIFEIAGTASPYLGVYLFLAAAFAMVAIAALVRQRA